MTTAVPVLMVLVITILRVNNRETFQTSLGRTLLSRTRESDDISNCGGDLNGDRGWCRCDDVSGLCCVCDSGRLCHWDSHCSSASSSCCVGNYVY